MAPTKQTPVASAPDMPPVAGADSSPSDIADLFRDSAREAAGAEGAGFELIPGKRRGRPVAGAPAEITPEGPEWTAEGVGSVLADAHDLVFTAYDLPKLEPEERTGVAKHGARFLNAVWPTGATYEPHAAIVLQEVSVILPRVAAYRLRQKQEQDKKKDVALGAAKNTPETPNTEKPPEHA